MKEGKVTAFILLMYIIYTTDKLSADFTLCNFALGAQPLLISPFPFNPMPQGSTHLEGSKGGKGGRGNPLCSGKKEGRREEAEHTHFIAIIR